MAAPSRLTNPTSQLATDAVHVAVVTGEGRTEDGGTVEIAYAGENAPEVHRDAREHDEGAAVGSAARPHRLLRHLHRRLRRGPGGAGTGRETCLELGGEVPDALWKEGTVTVTDRLLVVTSTIEFDPRSLQQGDLAVSTVPGPDGAAGPGGDDPVGLHAALDAGADARQRHHRRLPPRTTETIADWRTNRIDVVTTRPAPEAARPATAR